MMLSFNDFLGFARHECEKEEIIDTIVAAARNGSEEITIDVIDGFTDDELNYIKEEVARRL